MRMQREVDVAEEAVGRWKQTSQQSQDVGADWSEGVCERTVTSEDLLCFKDSEGGRLQPEMHPRLLPLIGWQISVYKGEGARNQTLGEQTAQSSCFSPGWNLLFSLSAYPFSCPHVCLFVFPFCWRIAALFLKHAELSVWKKRGLTPLDVPSLSWIRCCPQLSRCCRTAAPRLSWSDCRLSKSPRLVAAAEKVEETKTSLLMEVSAVRRSKLKTPKSGNRRLLHVSALFYKL